MIFKICIKKCIQRENEMQKNNQHLYLSSTFAEPSTSSPPDFPRAQRLNWANKYASTILTLAWVEGRHRESDHSG